MKNSNSKQHPQDRQETRNRRPFVRPEIKRRETLPKITNGFVGSFQP